MKCPHCGNGFVPAHHALTLRQSEILQYIDAFLQRYSVAPTYGEIAEAFGFASVATAHEHVHNLATKGVIAISGMHGAPRAITLLVRYDELAPLPTGDDAVTDADDSPHTHDGPSHDLVGLDDLEEELHAL